MSQKRYRAISLKTVLAAAVLAALLIFPPAVKAAGIADFSVKIPHEGTSPHDSGPDGNGPPDALLVSASVDPGSPFIKELQDGVEKKLTFYVDVFRKWHSWPDEFVLGRKIEREMECDNVKGEYFLATRESGKTEKKIYANCRGVMADAFSLKEVRLSNLHELNKAKYIVRVTAESKANDIAPLLGQIFFFIQEYEFKARADSQIIYMGTRP